MSKTTIIFTSLLSAIIGGLIVGFMMLALAGQAKTISENRSEVYVPGTGYKMLADFKCVYGEKKHIVMRGVDDGFVLGNSEPARRIPNLEQYPSFIPNHPYLREYDDTSQDKIFSDFFEIPANISSGVFIVRLEPKESYSNDLLSIGDLSDMNDDYFSERHHTFNAELTDIINHEDWEFSSESILSARLKDIKFSYLPSTEKDLVPEREQNNLLSYVQATNNEGRIDLLINDDTGVDYMGAAFCIEPEENLGLTFSMYEPFERLNADFQLFTCELDFKSEPCNPFIGDTLCSSARPIACFKDTSVPVTSSVRGLPKTLRDIVETRWGGGEIEFTRPIRGDALATLADANNVCVKTFGDGWRVLDFHDGGLKGVSSHRSSTSPNDRVWVNIKDQPRGTCWAQTDGGQMDKASTK